MGLVFLYKRMAYDMFNNILRKTIRAAKISVIEFKLALYFRTLKEVIPVDRTPLTAALQWIERR